jgi:predicted Zn-dependent protease
VWSLVVVSVVGVAEVAAASPSQKVAIASMSEAKPSYKGPVTSDELADRLALVAGWAIADREHVRDAEKALGWTGGTNDPLQLTALGKRLGSDLVIGGTVEGDTLHAVLVQPQAGKVDKLDAKGAGARPDQLAASLAKLLIARDKLEAPPLSLAAIEGVDGAGNDKAYEAYGKGREELFAKSWPAAIASAQAALKLDPKMGRARALEALARLKSKDYAGASAPAKAASDAAPGLREVRLVAARVEDYNDRIDAAIEAYKAVLAIAPNDAVAHSNVARLYAAKRRDHVEAAREYAQAVADEPAWPIPAFNLAQSQLELGRATEAVKTLEKLHEGDPNATEFTISLARAYRRADRAAPAVTLLGPVVKDHPTDVFARSELAQAQAQAGHADDAQKTLDAAPDREKVVLKVARARVLLANGDAKGAAEVLDAGRGALSGEKSALDRHEYLKTLGVAQLKLSKAGDAAKTLREVVDEDPLDAEALYDLGLALDANHDPGAGAQLARAVKVAPYLVPAVLADGTKKLAAGDAGAAVAAYRSALTAGADDPRLHLGLGLALWRDGKLDDGIKELKAAADSLADVGLQAEANYDLAEAQLAAHHLPEAKAAAAKYLQLEKRPGQEARTTRAKELAQ